MQNNAESTTRSIVNLCRSCEESLRRVNYNVRTVVPGATKTIRSCGFCKHRTYCGKYEVDSKPFSKRRKSIADAVAEEIAVEIAERNM